MSTSDRLVQKRVIMNAKAATGVGTNIDVTDYQDICVCVSSAANANLTVKCVGSMGKSVDSDAAPDFTAAQSATNQWDFIAMWDLEPGTIVAGATGMVFPGLDDTKNFMINVSGLKWLNFIVTAYAVGSVSVVCLPFSNKG